MGIDFSNIIFTDQDDIVPLSGVEEIYNSGIVNILAGTDVIIGTGGDYGFENNGIFDTSDDDDTITGTDTIYGLFIEGGTVDTGKGNDVITGTGTIYGIFIAQGILKSGDGDDIITGTGTTTGIVKNSRSEFNSGDGNDIITGTGTTNGIESGGPEGFYTEDGNDIITGTGTISGIVNDGPLSTGNGEDSIISQGKFINYYFFRDGGGQVYLGDGNDSIIVTNTDNTDFPNYALENFSTINTGEGNDIITSTGISNNYGIIETGNGEDIITSTSIGISNSGRIDTGNGEDSIISQGKFRNYGGKVFLGEGNDSIIVDVFENTNITVMDGDDITNWTTVINGVINTGEGNDSIIANGGFESDLNSSGIVVLGDGEDYIKGFGSGDFYGGNGNDTLELTPGSYSVGIVGAVVSFTKDSSVMITSEFEHLIAGGTIYDFTSLTECQTIFVA